MSSSIDIKKLIEVLLELRNASMKTECNFSKVKVVMDKYDILFTGEKFNTVNSTDLLHAFKNYFNTPINYEELLKLIPLACKNLGIEYQGLVSLENVGKTKTPDFYQIILW